MVDPLYPNRIGFKMNVPYLFSKTTAITSLYVKEAQTTFSFRKTHCAPSNQRRFAPRDITSPQEISAETYDLLDNRIGNRKYVQPKVHHTKENGLEQLHSPSITKMFPQPTMNSRF
jgi:hypothetical protein